MPLNIEDNFKPAIFLGYYLKALDLKKQDPKDFSRLKDLIKNTIIKEILPRAMLLAGVSGLGRIVSELEVAYEASKKLENQMLVFQIGTLLADSYSKVHQSERAEVILREILLSQNLNEYNRDLAKSQLASTLSEQFRTEEAAEIQKALIEANSPLLADLDHAASLWTNLGNSYRELGKLSEACSAFERALQFDSQMAFNESRKTKEFQTLTLLGQCLFMLGNLDEAEVTWRKAKSLKVLDYSGVDVINFHSILARCYFEAKIFDKALTHLNDTRENLYSRLEAGDLNPNVWESMLSTWSYIDGRSIEILLTNKPRNEAVEEALVIAEAAKGRLLSKMISGLSANKTSSYELSLFYYKKILNKVKGHVRKHSKQKILSLFAEKNGTAVFSINDDGSVKGRWIKIDQQFLDDYKLWNKIIRMIDVKTFGKASKLTEVLLDKIGEWLWHSNIDLAKGGEDLIIIPHGPLRNFPLSYCKLPNGNRLSECFNRVMILTSLYDLSASLESSKNYLTPTSRSALVDPDGSLPFARLEGLLIAGIDAAKIGSEVTANAIQESLSKQGIVLLSSHGVFSFKNAWESYIMTTDGGVELSKLLLDHSKIAADLVVLGVCEVGRSRISYSDEPIGFPGLITKAGVPAVVAPMWMVDDFSSHLFLTTFFQFILEGVHPASALQKTSGWLREAKASEVLDKIAFIECEIDNINSTRNTGNALDYLKGYLNDMKQLLQNKPSSLHPFESPLHWASFQITGFVPYSNLEL